MLCDALDLMPDVLELDFSAMDRDEAYRVIALKTDRDVTGEEVKGENLGPANSPLTALRYASGDLSARKGLPPLHRFLLAALVVVALLVPGSTATSGGTLHSSADERDVSSPHQLATAFSPAAIGGAYDFSQLHAKGLDGTGQTVALFEIDGFSRSDIQYFDTANALPDPSITEIYMGGSQFALGKSGETAMDIEWLHALAPGAAIQVYYLNNKLSESAIWRSMGQGILQAVDAGVKIMSISLGTCGPGPSSDYTRSALRVAMKRGVSVFVSSGDTGDHPGAVRDCGKKIGVAYPASDPSVVAVGGTSIQLTTSNLIVQERAWHKSGGGKSSQMLRPAWQTAPTLPRDDYRWAPDVAFVGDPNTGVSAYYGGRYHQVGGTSLGAPCWAAAWAITVQNAQNDGVAVRAAPKLLYRIGNSSRYAQAFHDVTSGSNGKYKAGSGWDPVTGWGSPDVGGLAAVVEQLSRSS